MESFFGPFFGYTSPFLQLHTLLVLWLRIIFRFSKFFSSIFQVFKFFKTFLVPSFCLDIQTFCFISVDQKLFNISRSGQKILLFLTFRINLLQKNTLDQHIWMMYGERVQLYGTCHLLVSCPARNERIVNRVNWKIVYSPYWKVDLLLERCFGQERKKTDN